MVFVCFYNATQRDILICKTLKKVEIIIGINYKKVNIKIQLYI